jgi:hypothetical protein
MHQLWETFRSHSNLKHIVNEFNDLELSLRVDMSMLPVGSTEWCMCQMKRLNLFKQCKDECIQFKNTTPTHSSECPHCRAVYFIDKVTS